jgi:Flp pilus assembly pilin Flp
MVPTFRMMRDYIQALLGGRELGQGMVEYTLIIGTISLVIVAAFLVTGISGSIQALATDIQNKIQP